jgi:hypothetical protein
MNNESPSSPSASERRLSNNTDEISPSSPTHKTPLIQKRNLVHRVLSREEPLVYQLTNPLLSKWNPSSRLRKIRFIIPGFYFLLLLSTTLFIYFNLYAAKIDGATPTRLTCFSSYRNLDIPQFGIRKELLCPGGCQKVRNWQPSYIASERLQGIAVIIGGEDKIYRGDSWVCPSAMHAGLIGNDGGGIVVETLQSNTTYAAVKGDHEITSFAFDSTYVISIKISAPQSCEFCHDQALNSVIFLAIATIILPFLPLSKRAVFWTVMSIGWVYQVFLSTGIV